MSALTGYEQGFRWEKQRADQANARVRRLEARADEVAKALRAEAGRILAPQLLALADRLEGSDVSGQEPR